MGMMRHFIACFCLLLGSVSIASAQTSPAPERIPEAEHIFQQAIVAFDNAEYAQAYRRFRLVYTQYPFHQKTTAALFMGAKSLFRNGELSHAQGLLTEFLSQYATSRYSPEAQRMLDRITRGETRTTVGQQAQTVNVGVLLPLTERDAGLTQAFFNGFRLAVEAHNDSSELQRVRIVFRDTQGQPAAATRAMNEVRDVRLVVGPLFSEEVLAAGRAADTRRIPLLAPLANDHRVLVGRSHVYLANPSLARRGRFAAQHALSQLRLRRVGVIALSSDETSMRRAEAFEREIMQEGGSLAFFLRLDHARDWSRVDELLSPLQLEQVEAIYLPVSGSDAPQRIGNLLQALARSPATAHLLGDAEWHQLTIPQAASRFPITYTNDFCFEPSREPVRAFADLYRSTYDTDLLRAPFLEQRLAVTGFDLGTLAVEAALADDVQRYLSQRAGFEGITLRIRFGSDNDNQSMCVRQYRNGRPVPGF